MIVCSTGNTSPTLLCPGLTLAALYIIWGIRYNWGIETVRRGPPRSGIARVNAWPTQIWPNPKVDEHTVYGYFMHIYN